MLAFLGTYADEATGFLCVFQPVIPLGKKDIELGIPHHPVVEREIVLCVTVGRLFPDPEITAIFVPGAPVGLVHGCAGIYLERDTDMIYFNNIGIILQYPFNIPGRFVVLYLIIHVENADFPVQVVFPYMLYAKVQHDATVLAAGKGYVNGIEVIENDP
jgi:hypothetical protein